MEKAVKSNELKKAVSDKGNELRAKNEVAAKPETNPLSLTEMEKEIGVKHEKSTKPTDALTPSF